MSQKIRIKLKSFDHNLVDKSAEKKWSNSTADPQTYLHRKPLNLR